MTFLVVLLCGVAVWANLWKQDLHVQNVKGTGNKIVSTAEILRLGGIQKNARLFDVDLAEVRRRVKGNPYIKTVSVNRDVPGSISINVVERTPLAALGMERLLFLDPDGVVLPPLQPDQVFDVPVLTGILPSGDYPPGQRVTVESITEALFLLATARRISDDSYHRISEVHIMQNKEMLLYTAESGVPVVFGCGDVIMKLAKLDGFWKEVVSRRGARDLLYIDVRFEDEVVVRWNPGTQAVKN
jgi:cell division protein FtsQ